MHLLWIRYSLVDFIGYFYNSNCAVLSLNVRPRYVIFYRRSVLGRIPLNNDQLGGETVLLTQVDDILGKGVNTTKEVPAIIVITCDYNEGNVRLKLHVRKSRIESLACNLYSYLKTTTPS